MEPMENDPITDEEATEEEELPPELAVLQRLLNMDMDREIRSLKSSISNLEKSQKDLEKKSETIEQIRHENHKLQTDCDQMKKENRKLLNRLNLIENKLLENNIVLHGIPDQVWELNSVTREKAIVAISHIANGKTLQEQIDITRKIGIRNVKHIGEYSSRKMCPISVEFVNKASADFLIEHKKNLPKGLFVDREYTQEIEKERNKLRPILRRVKELDEYKHKSKMEGIILVIKGKNYTVNTLDQLPTELSRFHASSRTNEDNSIIGFFGELSLFSNFHLCNFTLNNIPFHSSEQFIQYQKAKFCGDTDIPRKILNSETPLDCKLLSREIYNFDLRSWVPMIKETCEPSLTAKFLQNPNLLNILMSTSSQDIVECSFDAVWGNGLSLRDSNCLSKEHWKGQNLLGELLMSVRAYANTIIGNNTTQTDMQ